MTKTDEHKTWLNAKYDEYPIGVKPSETCTELAKQCDEACGTVDYDSIHPSIVERHMNDRLRADNDEKRSHRKRNWQEKMIDDAWNENHKPTIGKKIILVHETKLDKRVITSRIEYLNRKERAGNPAVRATAQENNTFAAKIMWDAYRKDPDGYVNKLKEQRINWKTGEKQSPPAATKPYSLRSNSASGTDASSTLEKSAQQQQGGTTSRRLTKQTPPVVPAKPYSLRSNSQSRTYTSPALGDSSQIQQGETTSRSSSSRKECGSRINTSSSLEASPEPEKGCIRRYRRGLGRKNDYTSSTLSSRPGMGMGINPSTACATGPTNGFGSGFDFPSVASYDPTVHGSSLPDYMRRMAGGSSTATSSFGTRLSYGLTYEDQPSDKRTGLRSQSLRPFAPMTSDSTRRKRKPSFDQGSKSQTKKQRLSSDDQLPWNEMPSSQSDGLVNTTAESPSSQHRLHKRQGLETNIQSSRGKRAPDRPPPHSSTTSLGKVNSKRKSDFAESDEHKEKKRRLSSISESQRSIRGGFNKGPSSENKNTQNSETGVDNGFNVNSLFDYTNPADPADPSKSFPTKHTSRARNPSLESSVRGLVDKYGHDEDNDPIVTDSEDEDSEFEHPIKKTNYGKVGHKRHNFTSSSNDVHVNGQHEDEYDRRLRGHGSVDSQCTRGKFAAGDVTQHSLLPSTSRQVIPSDMIVVDTTASDTGHMIVVGTSAPSENDRVPVANEHDTIKNTDKERASDDLRRTNLVADYLALEAATTTNPRYVPRLDPGRRLYRRGGRTYLEEHPLGLGTIFHSPIPPRRARFEDPNYLDPAIFQPAIFHSRAPSRPVGFEARNNVDDPFDTEFMFSVE